MKLWYYKVMVAILDYPTDISQAIRNYFIDKWFKYKTLYYQEMYTDELTKIRINNDIK